jgi:hypothetical protein
MAAQFEYKEFVFAFPPQSTWCRLASGNQGGYTEAGARKEFWDSYQAKILAELRTDLDNGWEPISEVGPAGISLKTSRELPPDLSFMGCMFYILLWAIGGMATFGLGFIIIPFMMMSYYARPVEFRVNLRKRK